MILLLKFIIIISRVIMVGADRGVGIMGAHIVEGSWKSLIGRKSFGINLRELIIVCKSLSVKSRY